MYRRSRDEMPANKVEIEAAEHEGVGIQYLTLPQKMQKDATGVTLTCIKMQLGEPDASGRRKPIPIPGSEFTAHASSVISAIGQGVDTACIEEEPFELKLTKWNTLDVNSDTFETNVAGIFAGGDCATGADIAVTAIAAGKKVASSIDQYLKGEKVTGVPKQYLHSMGKKEEAPQELFERVESAPRAEMAERPPKMRIRDFEEVETGFPLELARKEAERCLSCGCRSYESCTLRRLAVEYKCLPDRFAGAKRHIFVDESHPQIRYEGHKCILCGSCIRICSEVKKLDALGFVKRGFVAEMKPIFDHPWVKSTCDSCLKCVPLCPTGAISLKVTPADEVLMLRQKGVDASKTIENLQNPSA
jgi:formate dehydrogenase major subunit